MKNDILGFIDAIFIDLFGLTQEEVDYFFDNATDDEIDVVSKKMFKALRYNSLGYKDYKLFLKEARAIIEQVKNRM